MLEKLLSFLTDNSLYIAGGVLTIVLLMLNKKLRKYAAKVISLLTTLLLLYFAYSLIAQENKPAQHDILNDETAEQGQEKRKSIYYTDPAERVPE